MDKPLPLNFEDFSLTKGGPFFRLMVRSGLIKPDFARPARRATLLALIIWPPIFILSVLQGLAFYGRVELPFVYDFTVAVRFLICVPVLIIAEVVLDARTNAVVKHFVNSGLVRERDYPAYESVVRQVGRLRDSLLAEALLVVVVIVNVIFFRVEYVGSASTWQVLVSEAGRTRTLAGWWYLIVSIPFFQFLLWRWLWRFLIWSHFLRNLSKMDLRLIPTHPDLAAGLGFLSPAQAKYGIVAFALSAVIAAKIGEEILYGGASLLDYKFIIGGYIALTLIVLLTPLLVFTPKLLMVKRRGLLEYSALANEYTQAFDRKWVRKEVPEGELLLGSADIQSLADLGNSFAFVRSMRPFPVDLNGVIPLIVATALPMLPLVLTVYPFDELVLKIAGFLF
ncbi:MAG TPA: hypothetical protein VMO00_05820 [Methylomirabilota bacterium]|nr:hypothetical protein [Methylomirabilota bacterium]